MPCVALLNRLKLSLLPLLQLCLLLPLLLGVLLLAGGKIAPLCFFLAQRCLTTLLFGLLSLRGLLLANILVTLLCLRLLCRNCTLLGFPLTQAILLCLCRPRLLLRSVPLRGLLPSLHLLTLRLLLALRDFRLSRV